MTQMLETLKLTVILICQNLKCIYRERVGRELVNSGLPKFHKHRVSIATLSSDMTSCSLPSCKIPIIFKTSLFARMRTGSMSTLSPWFLMSSAVTCWMDEKKIS